MQTDDLAIHVLPLGGVWETIGADRLAGIYPENFVASANEWGSDTVSFDVRRYVGALHLDLAAFTPLEAEVAGEAVWSGRTIDAPSRDGADPNINVQAQGWQYHLDDDSYAQNYVHTLISEWRDARSLPLADLTRWTAAPTVSTDSGVVTLMWPKGQTIVAGTFTGIVLDLGDSNTAAAISIDYDSSNNSNGATLYARTAADVASLSGVALADAFSFLNNAGGASGSNRGTFATAGRYVALFMFNNTGADYAPLNDVWFRLRGIRVFGSDSYRNVDASILKASDVVKDAVTQKAPLITDTSQVQATTFPIPDLHFEAAPQSPREAITAVNALHNYITKVDVDRRLVFAPRPTAPLYEIGEWGGADFQDASAGSGADVYNRALVTGTGPDGTALLVSRYAAQQSAATFVISEQAASWASGGSATPADVTASLIGDRLPAGAAILIVVTPRAGAPNTSYPAIGSGGTITVTVGNKNNAGQSGYGDFITFTVDPTSIVPISTFWVPKQAHTDSLEVIVQRAPTNNVGGMFIDVYRGATVVDRRGFQRTKTLPVNAALTVAVANQLGDVYLDAHKRQPLKGNVDAVPTGIRRIAGGDVHPAHMLRETGQRLRLSHRIDPDTGGQGRDGMIATATYTHDSRSVAIALDEDRRNFDVLLARFAAVSPAA